MKSLEKDRTRRYETPNAMATDIQRHLVGDAIEARAPSTAYRLTKAVARHRIGIAVVAVLLFSLLVGIPDPKWPRWIRPEVEQPSGQ